jgi:lipoate-protein ligase A
LSHCRLLIDPPAAGAWNMAVDELLMHWAASSGGCCWRFYQWQEPTLSLGYFQAYEERQRHAASLGCPVVRRISGGGAIVHDAELTYSLAVPRGHRLGARRLHLYETVHQTLIDLLSERGIEASLCRGFGGGTGHARQPFLCFQRRAHGDVLASAIKLAGSAQRRSKGSVLQHGSVLLRRSPAAPELAGLDDLAETPVQVGQLVGAWLEKLSRRLALTWERQPLSESERHQAARLAETKFGADCWTRSRGRQGRPDCRPT